MKINLPAKLLSFCGVAAVIYVAIPSLTEQQQSFQAKKYQEPGNTNTSLAKLQNSLVGQTKVKKGLQNKQTDQVWQAIAPQTRPESIPENVSVEYIKVADLNDMKFSEGRDVSFLIPQEDKYYSGTINESTRAFGGKVNIASGNIDNGNQLASFSITEGENTTFVTVATGESIYQVEIDNQTGVGVILDDRELNQYRHNDDGILPPPEGVS